MFSDSSIIKNTSHVDFNDKKLYNVRFLKINTSLAVNQHLILKQNVDVDDAIEEKSLVKNNKDKEFNFYDLTNI